jgi:hypothetical protein
LDLSETAVREWVKRADLAAGLAGVVVLRRSGVAAIAAYLPIGLLIWFPR